MPEPLEYRGGPFAVSAHREGNTVFISIYRTPSDKLIEIKTSPQSARAIAGEIMKALD